MGIYSKTYLPTACGACRGDRAPLFRDIVADMIKPGGKALGTVPAPTHGFVGREDELEFVSTLLTSGPHRLITLAGPGGIGKTRLADETVRRVKAQGLRVHWVPLARLPVDAEYVQVERATASAVISADFSNRPTFDALEASLRGVDGAARSDRVLLVLDNAEHVLDALRTMIERLLDRLPNLVIMATSRSPVAWRDEYLHVVRQLSASDALMMFRQRTELIGRAVEWSAKDTATAAEICKHIQYHPLYIQLAVGRLRYQALTDLCNELTGRADDKRLEWTTGARAGADARHLGITNVIAWSYQLCSEKEKLLFTRLSAFAPAGDINLDDTDDAADAGAGLDAVIAVCSDDEHPNEDSGDEEQVKLSTREIAGLLESLADKSLVTIHITASGQRYSMPETLRVYAWDRLRDNGPCEPTRLARRHLAYYRDRVAQAAHNWFSAHERELVQWARSAWGNIVAAIEASITVEGEAAAGLEMCRGLITLRVPFVRGSIRDIRSLSERCLDASRALTPQPIDLQIELKAALAWLAIRSGQGPEATSLINEVIPHHLSDSTDWLNHPELDRGLPPIIELAEGTRLFLSDEDERAILVIRRARVKFHDVGDPAEVFAGMFGALAAALLGSAAEAHQIARCAVDHAEASGATGATSWVKLAWAVTLTKHGDPHEAAAVLRDTLSYQLAFGDQWGAMWSAVLRTWALERMIVGDDPDRDWKLANEIAQILGGTETLRRHLGVDITSMGCFAKMSLQAETSAHAVLGDEKFAAEMARGAELDPHTNDVHRLALGEPVLTVDPSPSEVARHGGRTAPNSPLKYVATPWEKLSTTEQEVAVLAAAGNSNAKIARHRQTSVRTVDRQISSVLDKLGIRSRHRIAEFVPDHLRPQQRRLR
ncbi:AAA family ATPase [Nocardia nova]|uniref:helix-turn-helix transcriptional regulator n=2 Tax=Nocardia nova TaxID=37330 RepID=UPI00378B7C7F